MRDFTYSSKRNLCPTCGKDHGCRIYNDGRVWCLRITSQHEKPDGYRIVGFLNNGMGASLVPDDGTDWREKQQRWQNERKLKNNISRRLNPLEIEKRDRAIRKMCQQIGLHPDDRTLLKEQRGMTDEQIKEGLYFSLAPQQDLPAGIPLNFPGVNWDGTQLTNQHRGIACVTFNELGQATGMQYRITDKPDDGSRYRWISNTRFSAKLPNGEFPLTFIRPKQLSRPYLGIVEGTGFKPVLSADRLGQTIIGAGGGQHAGSPQQLRHFIGVAKAEGLDTSIIQIYVDAGDAINPHVLNRVATIVILLQSWGHQVQIGWWGQWTKEDDDIDELEDLSPIQYIDVHRFGPLQDYLPSEPENTEPDSELYRAYCEKEAQEEESDRLTEQQKKLAKWENYPTAAKNAWRKWKIFTPGTIIDEKYFDYPLPKDNTIIGVKSGLGTGKTEWIKRVMQENWGEGWIALGYRNSLLLQTSERCGFYHLHQDDAYFLVRDPKAKIACCVDSLIHFQPEDFDDKILVIDEAVSVACHLLAGGTLKTRKDKCLELWSEAIKRAKIVILLDGFLTNWCVNYFKQLGDGKKVITIENQYVDPKALSVHFFNGTQNDEKIKANDRSPILAQIIANCNPELGRRPVIATDSQIQGEAIDKLLTKQGFSGIRIDSKTVPEEWCKAFLKDPDRWISQFRPDYLIYSPTAEAGLDISVKGYFTHQFCLFFGVLGTDSQMQMIGRIRDRLVERIIWCSEFARNDRENVRSPFVRTVEKSILQFLHQDALLTVDGLVNATEIGQRLTQLITDSTDVHFQTTCIISAIANYERANLRECLLETLGQGNSEIRQFTSIEDLEMKESLFGAVREVKEQNALDIFNATDLDPKLGAELYNLFGETWEVRCSITKARLKALIPGIEHHQVWSPSFIKHVEYDNKSLIHQCELFWLLHHPEVAKKMQQEKWSWLSKKEKTFLKSIRSRYSEVWALREAGFLPLLTLNWEWTKDSPEIIEFHQKCKRSKKIQLALGMSVGGSTPNQWFVRCLSKVGLSSSNRQVRIDGERERFYRIDQGSWNDPYRGAIVDSLPIRWKKYLEDSYPVPDFTLAVTNRLENTNSLEEVVTEQIPEDVIDICSWIEESVGKEMQVLHDFYQAFAPIVPKIPDGKRRILNYLSERARLWLKERSPEIFSWFSA